MPFLQTLVQGYKQAQHAWYATYPPMPPVPRRETCWREGCHRDFTSATGLCDDHIRELRSWSE